MKTYQKEEKMKHYENITSIDPFLTFKVVAAEFIANHRLLKLSNLRTTCNELKIYCNMDE
ncbi:MAG: hypothetical protein ACI9XJ_001258 [Marivirga sp.]|jgi:hypothetical protein